MSTPPASRADAVCKDTPGHVVVNSHAFHVHVVVLTVTAAHGHVIWAASAGFLCDMWPPTHLVPLRCLSRLSFSKEWKSIAGNPAGTTPEKRLHDRSALGIAFRRVLTPVTPVAGGLADRFHSQLQITQGKSGNQITAGAAGRVPPLGATTSATALSSHWPTHLFCSLS